MLKKAILIIFDGLGDRPIKEFNGLTPLEAAHTPNLDHFAAGAECGLMYTLGRGVVPSSDTAHFCLLGYDINTHYPGRGPIEARGVDMQLQDGDVALRANFATIETKNGQKIVTDRRAGRDGDFQPLTDALSGIVIDGVEFIVKQGTGYRAVVLVRGKGLSPYIYGNDPKKVGQPVLPEEKLVLNTPEMSKEDHDKAAYTASLINKFTDEVHERLKNHPHNKERVAQGLLPGNFMLARSAGEFKQIPTFKERFDLRAACIAGGGLYRGVAGLMGMDLINVEGATGMLNTNLKNKFGRAIELIQDYDFVFIHVKGTDSLGEDGNPTGKKEFIEKIDREFAAFKELDEEVLLVVTADHSTPCELYNHSGDAVPIMYHGSSTRVDDVTTFGERACAKGSLGVITGGDLMPQVANLLNKLPKVGG